MLVTSMAYAVAMSCDTTPSGIAIVDLTGTPFAVAQNAFVISGFAPMGSITNSMNDQVVTLIAGGYCGSALPAGKPNAGFDPAPFPLVYIGP